MAFLFLAPTNFWMIPCDGPAILLGKIMCHWPACIKEKIQFYHSNVQNFTKKCPLILPKFAEIYLCKYI